MGGHVIIITYTKTLSAKGGYTERPNDNDIRVPCFILLVVLSNKKIAILVHFLVYVLSA